LIEVREITKSFDDVRALKNVSFKVRKGEIFGFLGPNGAGKSTTINILNTLLKPDNGEVLIDGLNLDTHKEACKLNIGVVPQEIALYEELSAFDNLMFWGSLYNIPKAALSLKSEEALEMVGLSDRKNHAVKTYSGGMKRRINIASFILHQPKILLMDEPTVGVDPQSRNHIFEVIERLNDEGVTIIYTTHYMEEAERLCDTIAIIDLGIIAAQGNLKELRDISKTKDLLTVQLSELNQSLISSFKLAIPNCNQQLETNTLFVECQNIGSEISSIINRVQNAGGIIENVHTEKANLESIFLKLTGKQLRD
jgi:ABC-2 type transport system ATP-binding protein